MAIETLAGAITGTTGSDGNPTFTVPSGVTPIGEIIVHDGFVRTPGQYTLAGPVVTFLAPYIPIVGSSQPIIIYATTFSTAPATSGIGFDYTTTGLLAAIRDLTNAGSSQQDWPDERLIRLLNREIDAYLVPLILEARKDHFDTYRDQPLLSGKANYSLPSRAMGSKLRAAEIVDGSGSTVSRLDEVPLEEGMLAGNGIGVPSVYWWEGNTLHLFPMPSGGNSLRLYFPARPSTLVLNSACVQIASFPGGAPVGSFRIGFTRSVPAGFTLNPIDLVQNVPGFDILLTSSVSGSTGTTMDILGTQPADLGIGDWICASGTAPVVTGAIPDMVVGCLIKAVALEVMAAKGDNEAFARLRSLKADDERAARFFLRRRNEGNSPRVGAGNLYRFRGGIAF